MTARMEGPEESDLRDAAAASELEPVAYRREIPDVEAFARLLDGTGWFSDDPPSRSELAAALASSWTAVGAYAGSRLVGTGRVVADGVLHALIVDVIVEPEWQGRGVGRGIMERLVAACEAAGIRDVQLFCATGKRGFYERLGFRARSDEAPGMELVRPAR